MNVQKSLIRISELLSRLKYQISILNSSSLHDINIVSESFLIPILNESFDCSLVNANSLIKNFPAIDLIDEKEKICFQVTSTSQSQKIKETLDKIVTYSLYDKYDKFFIIILSDKQKYNEDFINKATQGKFTFTAKNIIDLNDLFLIIKSLPYKSIKEIEIYLNSQLSDSSSNTILLDDELKAIIMSLKGNYEKQVMALRIEGAYISLSEWEDKKRFLENNEASVFDVNQKYTLRKSIDECSVKISHYNNEISNFLSQIIE